MTDGAGTWRWGNVPVPEAHVAGLVVGGVLHVVVPGHGIPNLRTLWIAGWALIGGGIVLGAWAVWAAGAIDIENPSELVTTGPFAFSRNPMYVAWTALYVGVASITTSVWLFVVLPLVVLATHLIVRREERTLERRYGDAYREYTNDVRRYL